MKEIQMVFDENLDLGVFAVSMVTDPAIQENFILLSKENTIINLNLEVEKTDIKRQVVTGPILIPNKRITRIDKDTKEEYLIFFDEKTIQQISENIMLKKNQNNVTIQHMTKPIEDIYMIESWIVNDENIDKAKTLGFDVPRGTWMGSYIIKNNDVWQEFLGGRKMLNGFSIEGKFIENIVKMSEENIDIDKEIEEFLNLNIEELYLATIYSESDLDSKYIWRLGSGEEQCPACKGFANKIHTLREWTKIAIPEGTPNGSTIATVICEFEHSPYPTFCEEHCKCKLVKIVEANKKEIVKEQIKKNIINPFDKWKK